jgi:hypothetical protein
MATSAGIVFQYDPLEPPNPYLENPPWIHLPRRTDPEVLVAQRETFSPRRSRDGVGGINISTVSTSTGTRPHPPAPVPTPAPRLQQRQQALLPPSSISLAIQVIQDAAKATVTQLFQNDTPIKIRNGTYQLPLPHGSTVVDFNCRIGRRRIIRGQVKPREAARDEFDRTVRQGRMAGLVEQNTPEIFSTVIGNIPANTKLKAELSFIFFLKHNFARGPTTTTLTIPTYIAPRYGDPGFEISETGRQRNRSLSVDIDILTSDEIIDVQSDTHNILVERGTGRRLCQHWIDFTTRNASIQSWSANVKLVDGFACLDSDFVLLVSTRPSADSEQPQASLETHPSFEGHSAMMIEIPPKFMFQAQMPINNGEVVFLADRSGSMLDKIPGLKSSMGFFLRGIPLSRRINIWCFGSRHESLWPDSQAYGDDTFTEALSYVSGFSNDMGGTDLLPALESIAKARRGHGPLDVIVLTDGEVWREGETIEFVRATRLASEGAVRFFALGIGNAVSHELVEGIAKAGGGYAEVIPAASNGGWEDRVMAVLSAALTGHVGPLSIELEDVNTQDTSKDTERSDCF